MTGKKVSGLRGGFGVLGWLAVDVVEMVLYAVRIIVAKGLPAGVAQPSDVLLRSPNSLSQNQLESYRTALSRTDGVSQVSEPALSHDNSVADFTVTLSSAPESDQAIATVRGPLRSAAHAAAPPGTTAVVGGLTSVFVDFQDAMNHDYRIVFPVAAGLIMVVLALLLRSLVAPWYLMASVFLGFAATLVLPPRRPTSGRPGQGRPNLPRLTLA
jgi:RND superfamily putative drug exporter